MRARLGEAGGWRLHPMAHGMNPYAMVCGFGADLGSFPRAPLPSWKLAEVATLAGQMRLAPEMIFAFELTGIGGMVTVGEDGPIELNPLTARLPRMTGAGMG